MGTNGTSHSFPQSAQTVFVIVRGRLNPPLKPLSSISITYAVFVLRVSMGAECIYRCGWGRYFPHSPFFSCYWEKLSSPYQFPATITGVWALRAGGLEKTLSSSYHKDLREMAKRRKWENQPQGCPCRIGLPDLPDHSPVVLTAQAGRIHPNTKQGILSGRPGVLSS